MSRRMYSESQLNKMIDSKLEGYDASIPTDVVGDAQQNLHLVHDGLQLGNGTYVSKVFGKNILSNAPSGNIEVYDHYLTITGANSTVCWFEVLSTYPDNIHGTLSTQKVKLDNMLGTTNRVILCYGVVKASDGTNPRNIIALNWRGTWDNSQFYTSDLSTVSTAEAAFTRVNGTHYPLNIEDWK